MMRKEKMNAVHGDKMHSEKIVRCSAIYSSSEQLTTGLEARWYGERTGSGSPMQRKKRYDRDCYPLDTVAV